MHIFYILVYVLPLDTWCEGCVCSTVCLGELALTQLSLLSLLQISTTKWSVYTKYTLKLSS